MIELTTPPPRDALRAVVCLARLFVKRLKGARGSESCGSARSTANGILATQTLPQWTHDSGVAEQLLVTQPGPESME